eukprot:m.42961 g.42961  ORF g.42961 m.42961 type:complete len:205 (-) comp12162_c0_seq1:119-733(-)
MASGAREARMARELAMLTTEPPPGISCCAVGDSLDVLDACIIPGADTVYAGGVFRLEVTIPPRFPMQPPQVRFKTRVYHPNIDSAGRICLDTLKMPPAGSWKPSLSLATVLTAIQLLMAEANPDDGLMADIAAEYKFNRPKFNATAREWTLKYACEESQQQQQPEEAEAASQVLTDACDGNSSKRAVNEGDGPSSKRPCAEQQP